MKRIAHGMQLLLIIFLFPLVEIHAQSSCTCQTNICSSSCAFQGTTNTGLSCKRESGIPGTIDVTSPNLYCNRIYRYLGDADGINGVTSEDYFYYVRAVNGQSLPSTVNPDFNGDGVISPTDRSIVVNTIKNGGISPTTIVPATTTLVPTTTIATTTAILTKYKNGSYTYNGTYTTHQGTENYGVSLTISNDLVTGVVANVVSKDSESRFYQTQFKDGISAAVVGKPLDNAVNIGIINGASLTSAFFTGKAVPAIQQQAKV